MSGHQAGHGSVTFEELAKVLDASSIEALRVSKDRTTAMDDRMSIWELCELVREADFSALPVADNGDSSCASDSDAFSDGSEAEDPQETNFVQQVRLELFPEKSTDSDEGTAGDFSNGPCCVRGRWSPDGGPGTAHNPQVQLITDRVTLLRAELRAKLLEPNSTLELWLLQSTRWGKRVKQLASEENEEDKGEETILRKGITKRAQTILQAEQAEGAGVGKPRIYKIVTSAQSLSVRPGPIRVQLEVEVKAEETLTFVLARGRHELEQAAEKQASGSDAGASRRGSAAERRQSYQQGPRQSSLLEEGPLTRRGSARLSLTGAAAAAQALNKMQSRGSLASVASKGSSSKKSPTAARRRSSAVGRRGSQTTLPVLPVVNTEEDESKQEKAQLVKLVTIAPDMLTPPERALVRSWNPQEDYFELRIWGSTPLQKGPKLILTAADKAALSFVPRRDRRWESTVKTLERTADNLESAHEESWWFSCCDVAREARFGLNEQLDSVLAALRRLRLEDANDDPDFFKYCKKHRNGCFMLLDCVGKELGTPARY